MPLLKFTGKIRYSDFFNRIHPQRKSQTADCGLSRRTIAEGRRCRHRRHMDREPLLSDDLIRRIGRHLLIETPIRPADLLFVFGTRHGFEQYLSVIERLWRQQMFRWAIVSGGVIPGAEDTEAARLAKGMVALGISTDRLVIEDRATNTGENVKLSLPLLEQRIGLSKIRTLIAVGKDYTSARYLMTLQRHWPEVEKMFAPVHLYPCAPTQWLSHAVLSEKVLREWGKLGPYLDAGFIAPWPPETDRSCYSP